MAYYLTKPNIKKPLQSNIITPQLVSKIIEKGYPSFNGKFKEEFAFFGYDCKKEDRFYTTSLHDSQFYLANYIRIYFSWPDINAKEFKDFYIVLVDNKIDLRCWDRNEQDNRNQFEHHTPITDVNLIKQIEICFEKIVTYWNIESSEKASLADPPKTEINYSEVLDLLNLIASKPSRELELLAETMVRAHNQPESFPEPRENLHWEILSDSEAINEIIILDWKSDFEDIIWAVNESSHGKIKLKNEAFNPDAYADENLEIASKLIDENFAKYTMMYLDIPGDAYYLFIARREDAKRIIELGNKCNIKIGF